MEVNGEEIFFFFAVIKKKIGKNLLNTSIKNTVKSWKEKTRYNMKNTITIITGAASGIGRELAKQAAALGSYVMATDLNESGLAETKAMILAENNQVETHILDVSKPDAVVNFARLVLPKLQNKKLHLINNAGVALASGNFAETSLNDFEWLLNINLWGVIRMTKEFLPYMLGQNAGHIVNISSVFGLAGVAEQSAYCTAKFGVRGFTETLRMELMDTNVKTTVVHPGGISTDIAKNAKLGGKITPQEKEEGTEAFAKNTPTSAQEAARQILGAIIKQKPRLVIGNDGRMLDWITRLLPVGYTKIIKKQMEKMFGR